MSVPSDSNISANEFEKLSKYKDLEIEITKMWKNVNKNHTSYCRGTWYDQKGKREHKRMLIKFKEICLLLKFKK